MVCIAATPNDAKDACACTIFAFAFGARSLTYLLVNGKTVTEHVTIYKYYDKFKKEHKKAA